MRTVIAAAALVVSAACGARADGPPQIEVDRTACAHCRMLISEPVYAGAFRAGGAEAVVFDDLACMLAAMRGAGNVDALRIWVHDMASGTWIDGKSAVFVRSEKLRTPMGGGMVAFEERARADAAAAENSGRVIPSLAALLADAAKQQGGKP